MRQKRIALSLSILLLASLACKTFTALGSPQSAIPAVLTAVPTALDAIATTAADITPPAGATSEAGTGSGLGISFEKIKPVMESSKQFTFSDETMDGKPAVVARLTASAATAMPPGGNFSAAFIGDPANLSEIKINVPYSEDKAVIDAGLGMVTVLFASILPGDVLFTFLQWLDDNFSKVPDGGSQELVSGNFKFVLSRSNTEMLLDIIPAK